MTADDIRAMDADFLSAATVAEFLRMSPDRVREYARTKQLPFPAMISGNRVSISRAGLLAWIDGEKPIAPEPAPIEKLMAELTGEIHTQNILLQQLIVRLVGTDGTVQ